MMVSDRLEEKQFPTFSVAISVYGKDNAAHFDLAFESIVNQTCKPAEIVLVVDGQIPEDTEDVISKYEKISRFNGVLEPELNVIRLNQNKGLGNALRIAVATAKNDLIARMDSDDIAMQNRFEKQLDCFKTDSSLSIVGGAITEFVDLPENIVAKRVCPREDFSIRNYMKSRCGFNHMTVMFKKSDVLKAGNYQDWHYNEDYYLWLRMMQRGCKFHNLEDVLVNVRVGRDMYARRGGLKYFNSEYLLQKYMLREHIISFPRFVFNVIVRLAIEVAMPNQLRAFVFQKLLRK